MNGCHSCEYAKGIAAGRYRRVDFKHTPCNGCDVCSDEHVIEYNDNWVSEKLYKQRDERYERREESEGPEDMYPVSVMADFVKALLALPAPVRESVAMRFAGLKYREIGERLGVTTACAEKRLFNALRLWPQLQELFPAKVAKYKKRHRKFFPMRKKLRK